MTALTGMLISTSYPVRRFRASPVAHAGGLGWWRQLQNGLHQILLQKNSPPLFFFALPPPSRASCGMLGKGRVMQEQPSELPLKATMTGVPSLREAYLPFGHGQVKGL